MIRLAILLVFTVWSRTSPANDITKINALKKKGEIAFKAKQFDVAVSNYSYLIDTLHIEDDGVAMNLGHAYYQLGKKDLAQAQYQKLTLSGNEAIKSVAYQQLGAMANDPKTLEKALSYFKESIKSDPSNQDARYNYELVKKKLKDQNEKQDQGQDENQDQENGENEKNEDGEKKDQDKQDNQDQQEGDQNQDQENRGSESEDQQKQDKDQENQDPKGQDGQKDKEGEDQAQPKPEEGKDGEQEDKEQQQPPSPSGKMQEMNISEEKAKMILEALKNSEVQYIQQNRRKPTKRKNSGKPDW